MVLVNEENEMIKVKGGIGEFRYGYDTEVKCRWVVISKATGGVVAEVSNMAEAINKAKVEDYLLKSPIEFCQVVLP